MGVTLEYLREKLEGIVAQKAQALALYHQAAGAEATLLHLIEHAGSSEDEALERVKEATGADTAEIVRMGRD